MSIQPASPSVQQASQPTTPPEAGQGNNFTAAIQIAVGLAQMSQGGVGGIVRGVGSNIVSMLVQNAQSQGGGQGPTSR